jgi:hypothetical protein
LKIALLALVLIALISAGIALHVTGQRALVPTDPETLCPTGQPPAEVVVWLLDMTDEFTQAQKLKIGNEFERLTNGIARFGLIEAYTVDLLEQGVTKPVLHLCNPGTGAELSRWYENPELAAKKWKQFAGLLDTELERLLALPGSQTSAIFEAVQATALRTFNRPQYHKIPKRLVVVSDLMQNVPGKLNMYREIPKFEDFKKTPYFAEVAANLSGVVVTLLYLVRPNAPQKWPEHRLFWEQYFRMQGGTVELLDPVYGAASQSAPSQAPGGGTEARR